jgi:hypothetical protein
MKTAIFTLAALFGLGLGLAVVGVDFGLVILGAWLALAGAATLAWTLFSGLRPYLPGTRLLWALPPLLSGLMGLSLGAALARGSADLPAALLCGALTGLLHLLAVWPAAPAASPPGTPSLPETTRIATLQIARLIRALAPCRDPHLHRAARALRRAATTLAHQVDRAPLPEAARALALWLPALADAGERLRLQHLAAADPARLTQQTAALTETLARVAALLADLAPPDAPPSERARTAPLPAPAPHPCALPDPTR